MMLSTKIGVFSLIIIILYMAMGDFFGQFVASMLFPGELQDYIIVFAIFCALYLNRGKVRLQANNICFWPMMLLVGIAGVQMMILYNTGQQNIFQSLGTIKEQLYIFVVYLFLQFKFKSEQIIKYIIILDVISTTIYALEVIKGGPLIGSELHVHGRYENLVGISLWRSYFSPLFRNFTLSYLFVNILNKKTVFGRLDIDKCVFCFSFLGIILTLGRGTLFSAIAILIFIYFYVNRTSVYGFLKKGLKTIVIGITVAVMVFFFANGVFMRLADGVTAIMNVTDVDSGTTLAVRVSTLLVRYNYLIDTGNLLLGIGPYHWTSSLVVDSIDTYRTNKGVFAPDSGYATLLIRYGIIGTGLFIYFLIKNFMAFIKGHSAVAIATAVYILTKFIAAFGSGDAVTLLDIGVLFALCLRYDEERHVGIM